MDSLIISSAWLKSLAESAEKLAASEEPVAEILGVKVYVRDWPGLKGWGVVPGGVRRKDWWEMQYMTDPKPAEDREEKPSILQPRGEFVGEMLEAEYSRFVKEKGEAPKTIVMSKTAHKLWREWCRPDLPAVESMSLRYKGVPVERLRIGDPYDLTVEAM